MGAGQHERGEIGGGDLGVEALGDLDGGGGDPAADVQDLLAGGQVGELQELLGWSGGRQGG